MADVQGTTATGSASWHGGFLEDNVAHEIIQVEMVSLCDWPEPSYLTSTVEEAMGAAIVTDGSAAL
jgi:hypothetical protein